MRVLHLSTYPVAVPLHGGQARVASILGMYREAGIESRLVAVYPSEYYSGAAVGEHDVPFPLDSPHRDPALPPGCTDLETGRYAITDPHTWARLVAEVRTFRPDLVQLEQPWLWPFVRRLRSEGVLPPFRVVYSSQNIEAVLKRRLLEAQGQPAAVVEAVGAMIAALEEEVARAADLTIAVTAADAEALRHAGARAVTLALNGIVERRVDPALLRQWSEHFRGRKVAICVGSAHPPNVTGFWEMFAPSLAFLAPDERILLVGSIGDIIMGSPVGRAWERINESRLERAGIQSEENLAVLLQLASCVVLPITSGGGSNIKTAEAIFSGRPVIGTTLSLRGYDVARSLPRIHATDEPGEFRRFVKRALEGSLPPAGPDRPELRRKVLWSETLKELPGEILALS